MSGGSVLILDSDRGTVRQLTDLISSLPLQVYVALTKEEAIELSLTCRFDLCLVAHGLVDGNGLSFFADVLYKRDQSAGVLLSRHPDLRVVVEALDAGFAHVIAYPIDNHQILRIVGELFPDIDSECEDQECSCERREKMSSAGEPPDLKSIASLSMSAIRFTLSTSDLIRVIRSVDYPFAGKERLEYFDRDTLERVVCLVRRWSQQRLAAIGKTNARSSGVNELHVEESDRNAGIRVPA